MADEKDGVTLEFIARRLEAIQTDVAQLRDEHLVQTGIMTRLESAVIGLTTEIAETKP